MTVTFGVSIRRGRELASPLDRENRQRFSIRSVQSFLGG